MCVCVCVQGGMTIDIKNLSDTSVFLCVCVYASMRARVRAHAHTRVWPSISRTMRMVYKYSHADGV